MTANQLLVAMLQGNANIFKMTVADLSDADLLTRPTPTANHANWQLGHVIAAEYRMFAGAGAPMPELPAGFADKYNKAAAAGNDPAAFATKAQLLELFEKVRAGTIAWCTKATSEQLDGPAPETIRALAPTMGALAGLAVGHLAMHIGQIQVLRRALGKPVLF